MRLTEKEPLEERIKNKICDKNKCNRCPLFWECARLKWGKEN